MNTHTYVYTYLRTFLMYICIHICIYAYTHTYNYTTNNNVYIHIYIYIYIHTHSYLFRGSHGLTAGLLSDGTVGFHNFNLRIFNLRVSNPNKLIVDVFLTRCRISMCQGLGPKNTMKFRKSTVDGCSKSKGKKTIVETIHVGNTLYLLPLFNHLGLLYTMRTTNSKVSQPPTISISSGHVYIYIYMYTHDICIYTYIYIYIYIYM